MGRNILTEPQPKNIFDLEGSSICFLDSPCLAHKLDTHINLFIIIVYQTSGSFTLFDKNELKNSHKKYLFLVSTILKVSVVDCVRGNS